MSFDPILDYTRRMQHEKLERRIMTALVYTIGFVSAVLAGTLLHRWGW